MEKREKWILLLSLGLIGLAAGAYLHLPRLLDNLGPSNPNFIGLSTHASGDVKVKFGDTISWRKLEEKGRIYSQSYLFTGPNSTSNFAFLDKSTIKLGPNSLVLLNFDVQNPDGTVERSKEGFPHVKIGVLEGKVNLDLMENSQIRKIVMNQSLVNVDSISTSLILETDDVQGDSVAVLDGEVTMKSKGEEYKLNKGQKLAVKGDEAKREEVPSSLMEEMQRIAMEKHKRTMEEEAKKREFFYLMNQWYNYLIGNEETL